MFDNLLVYGKHCGNMTRKRYIMFQRGSSGRRKYMKFQRGGRLPGLVINSGRRYRRKRNQKGAGLISFFKNMFS